MSNEHDAIGVAVGSAIANQLAEVMPQIQADLVQGRPVSGISVRVALRPGVGGMGEGPVVAEIEFAPIISSSHVINIAPSPQTGQFTTMASPEAMQQTAMQTATQYPSAQMRPAPGPLVPRAEPMPVPTSFEQPGQQVGLTGAIPQALPPEQGPASPMTPDQYTAWYAAESGAPPAPAARGPLKRIARPPMPQDAGIIRTQ